MSSLTDEEQAVLLAVWRWTYRGQRSLEWGHQILDGVPTLAIQVELDSFQTPKNIERLYRRGFVTDGRKSFMAIGTWTLDDGRTLAIVRSTSHEDRAGIEIIVDGKAYDALAVGRTKQVGLDEEKQLPGRWVTITPAGVECVDESATSTQTVPTKAESRAIAFLHENPDITTAELARKTGCSRQYLNKLRSIEEMRRINKQNHTPPRGRKSRDGDIESWDDG
jgi:hypothetical protein